jgi:hypothetical protein
MKRTSANLELDNQQLEIDNSRKTEDTLRTTYTNIDLYQWMIGQVSITCYGAYKLAYDLAKRVERCYQYELRIPTSSFIQFGYWDSLHKGLHVFRAAKTLTVTKLDLFATSPLR